MAAKSTLSRVSRNTVALAADLRYWLDRCDEHQGRDGQAHADALEAVRRARAELANAVMVDLREPVREELSRREGESR